MTFGAAASLLAFPAIAQALPAQLPIRLRRGMNVWPWFSLTRELPPPSTDYDWPPFQPARPTPTRADLAALRRLGIDFIRLPIDPGPLLAAKGKQHEALLHEVAAAVSLANDEDLSVVVNLHPNQATHYWNLENIAGDSRALLFRRYLALVTEFAAQLTRFDPARVCFEPINEPSQSCSSSDWPLMQSQLIGAARAAAPQITLLTSGACGAMIPGLELLEPARLEDRNIIYTFHFYEPYVFSHQGAPWMTSEPMYRYLNAVPWPGRMGTREATLAAVAGRMADDVTTPAAEKRQIAATIQHVLDDYFRADPDKRFIERYFARVRTWMARHRIAPEQMLLGEFGALRTDHRYVAARDADRARYIRDVREVCEAAGIAWAFWNLFDGMGLMRDEASRRFDPEIVAALGLARLASP